MDIVSDCKKSAYLAARALWLRPSGKISAGTSAPAVSLVFDLLQCSSKEAAGDLLNELYRQGSFSDSLYGAIFASLAEHRIFTPDDLNEDSRFLLNKGRALLNFFRALHSLLSEETPPNLLPGALAMLDKIPLPPENDREFIRYVVSFDQFAKGRCFRFRNNAFEPVAPENVKSPESFFGFHGPRRSFREQFRDFASGKAAVPLLISSLPGHGKTQMTMSYALAHKELTLIIAPAEALEAPLEGLMEQLKIRSDRRFALFFDDVDPNVLDWYTFRTHVGGTYSPPENVMLIVASNYEFPPSILSRGRSVAFPTFDDVRCIEMVEEFLAEHGFRRPNNNLILLIAARYTEEFGQKRYTELSPRTLMRFLLQFEESPQKRRDIVAMSCGQMVTKPDSQLFYDFNIRLMRKMYGEEYIENMLKERLRNLG